MVMFVCNVCGTSLKKNKVEEHYRYQCRNCDAVSCIDCGQDFWGDDYILHNKCISEQEKYQGVCSENKGEQKQEQWVANVNAVISTYSGSARVRSLLQNCVTCPNLPRKQQKFTNFVASSFHEYNKGVVEEAWSIIEKASKLTITTPNEKDKQKPPTENGQLDTSATNGEEAVESEEEDDPPPIENGHSEKGKKPAINGKSSPEQQNGVSESEEEEDENEEEDEGKEEPRKNGADSAKLKKKKQKLERKKELASYQNVGKKLSKKQLKRIREDSISADLAASANEETNGANSETNRKDKKHKKKDRLGAKNFPSEPSDVIKENEEEDETSAQRVLEKAQTDAKLMAGVPRNLNIEPDDDEDDASGGASNSRFNWHKAIKSALKAEDDLSLPVKKLRKKVLAEFVSSLGGDMSKFKSEHEVWALFDKKLHSYPKAKILKDRVTLVK